MRDGVIVGVYTVAGVNAEIHWRVSAKIYCGPATNNWIIREFDSPISALDAFLKARVAIFTRLLRGEQVYSPEALRKRRELNLD